MPYFCIQTKRKIHLGDCDNCAYKKGGSTCIYLKAKIRGKVYYFSNEGKDYERRKRLEAWKRLST